jgi:beta-glucosidase
MSRIDDAVTRILRMKFEVNLFQNNSADLKDYPKFGSQEFIDVAYNAAAESITLLKNTASVLPLNKTEKILVTGPTANSMKYLMEAGLTIGKEKTQTSMLPINLQFWKL